GKGETPYVVCYKGKFPTKFATKAATKDLAVGQTTKASTKFVTKFSAKVHGLFGWLDGFDRGRGLTEEEAGGIAFEVDEDFVQGLKGLLEVADGVLEWSLVELDDQELEAGTGFLEAGEQGQGTFTHVAQVHFSDGILKGGQCVAGSQQHAIGI